MVFNEGESVNVLYDEMRLGRGIYTETMQNENKDGYVTGVLLKDGTFISKDRILVMTK